MLSTFTVVLDANVLYGARLRSLFVTLARAGMFRARWTEDIHREWMSRLRKNRPDIDPRKIEATRKMMDDAVPDGLVKGYGGVRINDLPDPHDRHVVAAAVLTRAAMIVTFNLKDFPAEVLSPLRLEARHPDDFLLDQYGLSSAEFLKAVRRDKAHYLNPPLDTDSYLSSLGKAGVPKTVDRLRDVAILLD